MGDTLYVCLHRRQYCCLRLLAQTPALPALQPPRWQHAAVPKPAAGSVAVAECGACRQPLSRCSPDWCLAEHLMGTPKERDRLVGHLAQPCAWQLAVHTPKGCLQPRAAFWLPGGGVPAAVCPDPAAQETAAALQQAPAYCQPRLCPWQ